MVIQHLASLYSIAKFVTSTHAKSVIPVLEDIYDTFRNSIWQKSDNGPRFNSKEIENFAKDRSIKQVKTLLKHPSPTNIETVMKVLGIAIKIGQFQNLKEKGTLSSFWSLVNYHKTPHSAIDVSLTKWFFEMDTGVIYHTNYCLIRK